MFRFSLIAAAVTTALMLAGCAAGTAGRIEPPAPPLVEHDPVVAEQNFREAMTLARAGRLDAAARYYRTAAENGHLEAQYVLATMYRTGRGMPRDQNQALQWYGRSAEGGFTMAQFTLGNMYLKGDGVARDIPMAISLLTQAAAKGHPQAQYNLGVIYYDEGTAESSRKAEKWFLRAAGQGEPASQYALGRLYSTASTGIVPDPVRAYAWYSLAAANGQPEAEAMVRRLESTLSAAERASGRAMARQFAAEKTK